MVLNIGERWLYNIIESMNYSFKFALILHSNIRISEGGVM